MIRERRLGPDHHDVAISLNNLAVLYRSQGRFSEAESPLKRALAIKEKQLGPNHPGVLIGVYNLATIYADQRKYVEAEPLQKRALTLIEKHLGRAFQRALRQLANVRLVRAKTARTKRRGRVHAAKVVKIA